MPIIDIPNFGPMSFPDDMPKDQIQSLARKVAEREAKKATYTPDYRDMGLGRLASNAFSRSMSRLGSTVTDLVPALVGSGLGFDDYAREQLAESKAKEEEAQRQNPTAFKSYKDVGGIGQGLGFVAETGGEILPDALAMLLSGGIGGAVGKRAILAGAKKLAAEESAKLAAKGATQGSLAGIYGSSLGLNVPSTFQGIYEKTGNLEPDIALTFGAAQAALDSLIPARLLSQFSPAARAKAAEALIQRSTIVPPSIKMGIAKSLATTIAGEGVTESTQELLSILAEKTAGAEGDVFNAENVDRLIESGIKGAIGGGLLGAPGSVVEARSKKKAVVENNAKLAAEEEAKAEAQAAAQLPAPTPAAALGTPVPPTASIAPTAPIVPTNPKFVEMVQKWNDANLAATLKMQLAKTPEGQNKPLIAAIQAEIAKRIAAQGGADVSSAAGAEGVPVDPAVGESTSVAVEPGTGAPAGVGVSEPAGVAPTEPVVDDAVGGEGSAVDPLGDVPDFATPPVVPEAAPVAPALTPELEAMRQEMVELAKQRIGLMTEGGRVPFKNSPARKKFDALGVLLDEKQKAWKDKTGTPIDIPSLFASTNTPVAPAPVAPAPVAPAPVEPPVAPPVAPAPVEPPVAKAEREDYWKPNPAEPNNPASWQDTSGRVHYDVDYPLPKGGRVTELVDNIQSEQVVLVLQNSKGEEKIVAAFTRKGRTPAWMDGDIGGEQVRKGLGDTLYNALGTSELKTTEDYDKLVTNLRDVLTKKEAAPPEAAPPETEVKPKFTAAEKLARAEEAQRKADEANEPKGSSPETQDDAVDVEEAAWNMHEAAKKGEPPAPEYEAIRDKYKMRYFGEVGELAPSNTERNKNVSTSAFTSSSEDVAVLQRKVAVPAVIRVLGDGSYRVEVKGVLEGGPEITAPEGEAKAETEAKPKTPRKAKTEAAPAEPEPKVETETAAPEGKAKPKKSRAKAKTEAAPTEPKTEAKAETEEPKKEKPAYTKEKQDLLEQQNKLAQKQAGAVFQDATKVGYLKNKKEWNNVSEKDEEVVRALLNKSEKPSEEDKAAQAYFSKVPNIVDVLENIAFDITEEVPHFNKRGATSPEAKFFEGTGGETAQVAARWVEKNLGTTANKQFKEFLEKEAKRRSLTKKEDYEAADKKREAYSAELKKQFERAEKEAKRAANPDVVFKVSAIPDAVEPDEIDLTLEEWMNDRLFSKVTSPFADPLHPVIRQALYNGNLQQALNLLMASSSGRTQQLAKIFAGIGLNTKVEAMQLLKDASGNRVPGYYDPTLDTVFLDAELGANTHTLFHELSHAATSHVLSNPSHPVTKQLTNLFNDVRGSLDTAYGAQSLDEFVAETWANDEFKAKLNSINSNGSPITAWQRFTNTIRNFFRRLMGRESASIETAYDVADKAIMAILSPAPNFRDGVALYSATLNPRSPQVNSWLDEGMDALEKLPGMNAERANAVDQFIRNSGKLAKSLLFSTLPLDTFVDIAKKHLPGVVRVNELVNQRKGEEQRRMELIESAVMLVEKWAKTAKGDAIDKFNDIVYDSTYEQVDPTRPRQFYIDAFSRDPKRKAEALATWDKLNKDLNALEAAAPGAKRMYNTIKGVYASLRKEIIAAMQGRVDEVITDKPTQAKFKNELLRKLLEKGEIDPYFPLTRNGDFWLSYDAKSVNGNLEHYVEAFETERERKIYMKELENRGAKNIQKFANLAEISYKNVPNTAFVHDILQMMEINRPSDPVLQKNYNEAMEQVMRMYLTTMPETAFAKALTSRKKTADGGMGVLGFRKDAIRALREKAFSISRQISNMKFAAAFNAAQADLMKEVKKQGKSGKAEDNQLVKDYYDEMAKRISFAKAPNISKVARTLNSITFTYLLGFNISSALINLTQMPLIIFPHLAGKYGYKETYEAVNAAARAYGGSGFKRSVEIMGTNETLERGAMPSIDNIDFDAKGVTKNLLKYKTLVEHGRKMGQFNRSQMSDVLEADGSSNALDKVTALSGWCMHQGERFNREVTLMAAYDLELQRLNGPKATAEEKALDDRQKEEAAANHAVYIAELTNGGTAAAAAPPIAQNAVGRVLWMFKSYGVKMNYLLIKTAKEALKGESPEVRRAAFYQLVGILGNTALFAGLQGLPLFGVVAMIYNLFKDDDDEDFGSVVRGATGEMAYKGLLNSLTGLSFAERIGLSNLIFKDSPFSSGSATVVDTVAQLIGGPFLGVVGRLDRAYSLLSDGQLVRGVESMLPVAGANVLKSVRYATEGANTLRGDPIIGDVNAWNVGAQALGFTPAEYTRQLEINASIKGIEKAIIEKRTKALQKMNAADNVGDLDGAAEAEQVLRDLYDKYPELGDADKTIARSRQAAERVETVNGIVINAKLKDRLKEVGAYQAGE